ncbi:hypothetical protein F5Y05DRAFT_401090 [Hypoxylon sp. FL0543]|nr:hypothetical protein F5Y05DRAFT_401090 [Hypoxylon sp. FL0543]
MSGDQPTPSFGDPNAQPPTPKQTPTSAGFPSSVFETPKNNRASFEESSAQTPKFAEEYSVFNSTPGNLKAPSHGQFVDFSFSTPFRPSNHKRPLSTDSIAAEIATHVTHFSPNPNLPLPPVDPSRRLSSSPGALVTGQSPAEAGFRSGLEQVSSKKAYRDIAQGDKTQTATPPPSTHKGKRRLAPKLQTDIMQNDGFEQEFVAGTPHQQHMPNYMSTPSDLFGYPMSAPAAASSFGDSRMFWDTDMGGMDLDFSTAGGSVFQTPVHRPMNSLDWGRSNETFQEAGSIPQSQENNQPAKKERAIAPKPPASSMDANSTDVSMFGSSFAASADDSFAMMNQHAGVDPGLLFTRPPSSSMESAPFNPMSEPPLMQSFSQPEPIALAGKAPKRSTIRRSASTKEAEIGKKVNRASASSPIKPSDRPGLSRSFSEKISRKPVSKTSTILNLAPATRPTMQNIGRSASQGSRPNGRISPLKSHQHRLSSLTSIPETPTPRTQTSVKFTIDSRGRARAETTTIVLDDDDDNDMTPTVVRRRQERRGKGKSWSSSEDEDSSTDDEPIIIPSRNTSFALPEPRRLSSHSFHSSQRSVSEQSTSSLGIFYNEPDNDAESEAETVMNVTGSSNRGDAASELRKVLESRQKRASNANQSFASRSAYSSSSTATPVSSRTHDFRTPSTDGARQVRCVCDSNHVHGNHYMVQCKLCEMWLHGKCINITRQTLPRVYVCAFCANTPNAHGRGREMRRTIGGSNARASNTSPLAHKSFKSFR